MLSSTGFTISTYSTSIICRPICKIMDHLTNIANTTLDNLLPNLKLLCHYEIFLHLFRYLIQKYIKFTLFINM